VFWLDEGDGIPVAEKPKRIAELEFEIRNLERQEEALVTAAQEAALDCPRRPTMSGYGLLGLDPVDSPVFATMLEQAAE
jgi:hypothetical protein